jgi:cardiolipin synthase
MSTHLRLLRLMRPGGPRVCGGLGHAMRMPPLFVGTGSNCAKLSFVTTTPRPRLFNQRQSYSTDKGPEKEEEKSGGEKKSLTKKIINAAQAAAAKTTHENIYTIPNMLTIGRLFTAPVIGYLVVHHQTAWAFGLFALSCVTDLLDGYIARKYKLQTVVGSVIDPMADKALMMTLASCLAVSGDIPLYAAVVILGRDVLLGLSALVIRYKSLPPPKTFTRYWDFSLPSAEVHPTQISKYNTFLQMLYLGTSLMYPAVYSTLDPEIAQLASSSLTVMGYVVTTTTILSGLSYVFSANAVKIVTNKQN